MTMVYPEILRIYENDDLYGCLLLLNMFVLGPFALGAIYGWGLTLGIWMASAIVLFVMFFMMRCD